MRQETIFRCGQRTDNSRLIHSGNALGSIKCSAVWFRKETRSCPQARRVLTIADRLVSVEELQPARHLVHGLAVGMEAEPDQVERLGRVLGDLGAVGDVVGSLE